jgi:hypothetical protein
MGASDTNGVSDGRHCTRLCEERICLAAAKSHNRTFRVDADVKSLEVSLPRQAVRDLDVDSRVAGADSLAEKHRAGLENNVKVGICACWRCE